MMKAKLQSKRNSLESLVKRKIKELEKESIEVGHFQSQGLHYSGYSYPELMHIQATGGDGDWPARPLLAVTKFQLKTEVKSRRFKVHLNQFSKDISKQQATLNLLNDIGQHVGRFEQSLFGVSSSSIPANSPYTVRLKGANTPLVDSGDLRDHVAHKNTKTNTVKEVGS